MAHKARAQDPSALNAPQALLRRELVTQVLGFGYSQFAARVRDGRMPPPIRIGRSARWLATEIRAVLAAMAAGANDDQLRELVSGFSREGAFDALF